MSMDFKLDPGLLDPLLVGGPFVRDNGRLFVRYDQIAIMKSGSTLKVVLSFESKVVGHFDTGTSVDFRAGDTLSITGACLEGRIPLKQ